ncbi:MAG: hypothetical protein NUV72_08400, partial [Bauldia sp.]|nr:hypothetical protein [Bauldia sp.]
YDSATGNGDSITLTGFRLTLADGSAVTVPALIFTGVAERDAGGFTAVKIVFNDGAATARGNTATWASASAEDVIIPTPDEAKHHAKLRPFRAISATGIILAGTDFAAPISLATVVGEIGDIIDGQPPAEVLFRATGVRLPAAIFAGSVAGAIIGMLDYKEFVADVSMDGTYDTDANTATVDRLAIDVPTVGKITLAAKASGFSIRAITDPNPEVSKAGRASARLDTASLRLDNAGFVERMLDMQAGMLGGTRDDVRAQLVDGALPFALSFVENEAFRNQFQAAMAAFLADPRSLTITAAPASPVPLGQVMRTAARSPATLPDLLAPTVEANN